MVGEPLEAAAFAAARMEDLAQRGQRPGHVQLAVQRFVEPPVELADLVLGAQHGQPGRLVVGQRPQVGHDPHAAPVALAVSLDPGREHVGDHVVPDVRQNLVRPAVQRVQRADRHVGLQRQMVQHLTRRRVGDVRALERNDGRRDVELRGSRYRRPEIRPVTSVNHGSRFFGRSDRPTHPVRRRTVRGTNGTVYVEPDQPEAHLQVRRPGPGSDRIALAVKLSPRAVLWLILLPVVIYILVLAYRGG